MLTQPDRTEKHEMARNSLPDELKPIFDQLVESYRYYATIKHGGPWVSHKILAELVREGWRYVDNAKRDE